MLEDSITSSPSKSNKSIHKTRWLRKNKRKKLDQSVKTHDHEEEPELNKIIHDFYEDSEEQSEDVSNEEQKNNTFIIKKPEAIVKNYKPFEMEKRLAMADRLTANQNIRNKGTTFEETQGFYTCQTLVGQNKISLNDKESSFIITESELVNCCHQAEKVMEPLFDQDLANSILREFSLSPLSKGTTSPQHDFSLVNSILEDFSQSPITKEHSVINTSLQYTPEFRLRRKPIRTYSRKCLNQTRTNLSKRLDYVSSVEEDDNNSNCSSISIQEDIAPLEGVSNPSASAMNTSQRLCENLINLSALLTQNSPTDNNATNDNQEHTNPNSNETFALTSSQEILSSNIPDLLLEIRALRSKSYRLRTNSYDSNEDFYGFSSPKSENCNITSEVLGNQNLLNETVMEMRPEVYHETLAWNEDDCQDIFACINTDEILLQHNISKNLLKFSKSSSNAEKSLKSQTTTNISDNTDSKKPEKNVSSNSMDFKMPLSKRIIPSRDDHKLPDIPVKSTTKSCDNSSVNKDSSNKDANLFENPDDDEWNDDCDFFINFRTPLPIIEKSSSTKEDNKEILKEKFSYENDFPSTSKMALKANMGFQTAAGKNVSISKKAQESVQKLLKEFATNLDDNNDCDKLKEMKTKIYTKTHGQQSNTNVIEDNIGTNNKNLNNCLGNSSKCDINLQSSDSTKILNGNIGFQPTIGFQTAKGRDIKVSTKAQKSVEKLLKEFQMDVQQNFESDLGEIKQNILKKNNKFKADITLERGNNKEAIIQTRNSNKMLNFDENQLLFEDFPNERKTLDSVQPSTSKVLVPENMGFQTAKGKSITISKKAQKGVEKLLKEFNTDCNENFVSDLESMKMEVIKKSNKIKSLGINRAEMENYLNENNEDLANMVLSEWPLSNRLNNSNSCGQKDDSTSKLENPDAKNQEELLKHLNKSSTNEIESDSLKICNMDLPKSTNIGFQTAKGNKVLVSAKAQSAVNKLLKEFHSDLNVQSYEKDLMAMKSNIELKNKELKQISKHFEFNSTQDDNEYANIELNEWHLSPRKDLTPKLSTAKRKLSIDNSDIPSPLAMRSPPRKQQLNKELYGTKSSFAERAIKSPLNSSPAHSIIARKNLLSLTKRRKNKRNLVENTNQDESNKEEQKIPKMNVEFKATPIKSSISMRSSKQTPATPNLNEFFSNAAQTSTPRPDKLIATSHTPMDKDFNPITWESNNDTTAILKSPSTLNQTPKLSDSTCSNKSLNSSNPSAKERIARLKMYGKAPAVSPILIDTHNNCRPSGLRRTRSMLKKK